MRKINVTTTIEVPESATEKEIYDKFLEVVNDVAYFKDLTCFLFINPETNEEIEFE